MRTWVCSLSLLFAVSGWARLPVPPSNMPAPSVVRTVDVRADESPVSVAAWHVEARVGGAFATVTTSFTVHNPNARPLEGRLNFPSPTARASAASRSTSTA